MYAIVIILITKEKSENLLFVLAILFYTTLEPYLARCPVYFQFKGNQV